jgi:hypothetical protein
MLISRSARVAIAAAALALTLPAAASAKTTTGSVAGAATQNTAVCPDQASCTLLGDNARIAADGVVTGWHLKSGSIGGEVRLRVLRPAGAGKYTGAGTSEPQKVTRDDPYVNDYPTRLPVKAGDVLGVENSSNALVLSEDPGTVKAFTPSVGDGATAAPTANEPGARRLLLTADVEPDADGDGYGDESQDACPAAGDRHVAPCTGAQADVVVEQQLVRYVGAGRRAMELVLKVHNNGPSPATNVALSDIELTGGIVTGSDARCGNAVGPSGQPYLRCPIGTLAPGATETLSLTVSAADAKAAEITNRIVAFAAEGDPLPSNNSTTRTFNIAPLLNKKVSIDAPSFLVAGREDLLRSVHVLYTLNERATVTLSIRSSVMTGVREARFTGYPGLNAQRDLFTKSGLLSRLKPGIYVGTMAATDAGFLEGVARKFKFRVYDKRPV